MALTDKEKEDINRAIYEYLVNQGFEKTADTFKDECPSQVARSVPSEQPNILARKWVTIVSLNKKILQLEQENAVFKEELKSVSVMKKTTANKEETENFFPKGPPKHTFSGHKDAVDKVAMHPMYMQLASVGEKDEMIKLWDYEALKYEGGLKGHTEKIKDISYDPTGSYLASGAADMLVKVWDLNAKTCIKTFTGHDHTVNCVRWKSSGDFILSASSDCSIKLWELATGFCVRTYRGHEKWIRHIDFNSQCNKFASASDDGTVMLWDYNKEGAQNTLYGHSTVVECVIFVNSVEGKKAINEAKYNPEGKAAIEANLSEIEKSKKKLQEKNTVEDLTQLEFLISGSRDKSIRIWSGQTGNTLLVIEAHAMWIKSLSLHHSQKYFYSTSEDKTVKTWSLGTGKLQSRIEGAHENFINCVASHPAYLFVATCSTDKTVKLWECR